MLFSAEEWRSCWFQQCSSTLPKTHRSRIAPLLHLEASYCNGHGEPNTVSHREMGLKSACAKLRLPQLTKKWGLQRGDSFHFEASICFSAFRSFWSVLKLQTWTVSEFWISQVSIFWINTYQLQIDQQNLPMIKHKHKPTFSQDDYILLIWWVCCWESPASLNYLLVCVDTNIWRITFFLQKLLIQNYMIARF